MSDQGNDDDTSTGPISIAPITPDFIAPRVYPVDLDPRQMQPSGVQKGGRYPLQNPGAIFDTPEDAAHDINSQMNGVSVADNAEYKWGYYRDPITGKVGYTDPYHNGRSGGVGPVQPTINGVLGRGKMFGMGHTHGDYSDVNGLRTNPNSQYGDADNFSRDDFGFMKSQYNALIPWSFFTLGTPSGQVLQWVPPRNGTDVLFDKSF